MYINAHTYSLVHKISSQYVQKGPERKRDRDSEMLFISIVGEGGTFDIYSSTDRVRQVKDREYCIPPPAFPLYSVKITLLTRT